MSDSSTPSEPASTRSLYADGSDAFVCPKCSEPLADMDTAVAHVFDAHEPLREFALRWSTRQPHSTKPVSTKDLYADGSDAFVCPKCSELLEDMDAVVDHVFGVHDPVREFALRWGGGR